MKLPEFEMPKAVCVAGSVAVPPLGIGILLCAVLVTIYLLNLIFGAEEYNPPSRADIEHKNVVLNWIAIVLGALLVGVVWVALGLWSYIHCHKFWHGERPQRAKDPSELQLDYDFDYRDCLECEEFDPKTWHQVGECEHYGTTGYNHAVIDNELDMHGIALVEMPELERFVKVPVIEPDVVDDSIRPFARRKADKKLPDQITEEVIARVLKRYPDLLAEGRSV